MLRNPLYAGKFWWAGVRYDGKDPTIIGWELFEQVQARMDGFAYTRPQRLTFAYTGMLTCGSCGAAITAELKKKTYTYYRCARACAEGKYLREERVREMYLEAARALHLGDDLHASIVGALKQQRGDVEDDVRARMADAHARVERYGRLIDKAYEDKLEGRVTDEYFHEKRGEWERQRSQGRRRDRAAGHRQRQDPGHRAPGARTRELRVFTAQSARAARTARTAGDPLP